MSNHVRFYDYRARFSYVAYSKYFYFINNLFYSEIIFSNCLNLLRVVQLLRDPKTILAKVVREGGGNILRLFKFVLFTGEQV